MGILWYTGYLVLLMCVNAHTSDLLRSEICQIISNPQSPLSVSVYTVPSHAVFSSHVIGSLCVCNVYLLQADVLQEQEEHVLAGCQWLCLDSKPAKHKSLALNSSMFQSVCGGFWTHFFNKPELGLLPSGFLLNYSRGSVSTYRPINKMYSDKWIHHKM